MKIPVYYYERALTRITETERKAGNDFDGNVYLDVPEYYAVVEALEKQIQKEHHHTRVVEVKCKTRESVCPACLGVIITVESEYPKHCTWCGQAIDWSDGERKENE